MLDQIQTITFSFPTLDCWAAYLTFVRHKLEYALIVWNSVLSADTRQLECIQRNFMASCQNCVFSHDHVTCREFFKILKLYVLHNRRLHLDALFLISVHSGLKCCPSLILLVCDFFLIYFRNSSVLFVTYKTSQLLTLCAKMLTSLGNTLVP